MSKIKKNICNIHQLIKAKKFALTVTDKFVNTYYLPKFNLTLSVEKYFYLNQWVFFL